jgi:hypothetical protein
MLDRPRTGRLVTRFVLTAFVFMGGRGTGIAIAAARRVARLVMCLCDRGAPIGLRDSALRAVVVREARVPIEEE